MYVDTHAHLFYNGLKRQLDGVIERAKEAGVERIICVATDLATSRASIEIAQKYPGVFATVGIHPHEAKDAPVNYRHEIETLATHPSVVAVGEIGLDFYRMLSGEEEQIEVFSTQLELAGDLNLPAVVHDRDAHEALVRVIESVGHPKGVVHCFTGGIKEAKEILNSGFKISFTSTVIRGNRKSESVLKQVALEAIMLETDSPFLSPFPDRGGLNEPANLPFIASKIAEIREESLETISAVTTATAHRFFGLPR